MSNFMSSPRYVPFWDTVNYTVPDAGVIDCTNIIFLNFNPGSLSINLNSLTDVVLTNPLLDGQCLVYDTTTSKWINEFTSVASLGDVDLTPPLEDGQSLVYDTATSKWINDYTSLASLNDVNVSSPADGQVLTYDSGTSKWVASNNAPDVGLSYNLNTSHNIPPGTTNITTDSDTPASITWVSVSTIGRTAINYKALYLAHITVGSQLTIEYTNASVSVYVRVRVTAVNDYGDHYKFDCSYVSSSGVSLVNSNAVLEIQYAETIGSGNVSDVDVTGAVDGAFMYYDGGATKWKDTTNFLINGSTITTDEAGGFQFINNDGGYTLSAPLGQITLSGGSLNGVRLMADSGNEGQWDFQNNRLTTTNVTLLLLNSASTVNIRNEGGGDLSLRSTSGSLITRGGNTTITQASTGTWTTQNITSMNLRSISGFTIQNDFGGNLTLATDLENVILNAAGKTCTLAATGTLSTVAVTTFNADHATDFLLRNNSTGTLTLKSVANSISLNANTASLTLATTGAITSANFASLTLGTLSYTESSGIIARTGNLSLTGNGSTLAIANATFTFTLATTGAITTSNVTTFNLNSSSPTTFQNASGNLAVSSATGTLTMGANTTSIVLDPSGSMTSTGVTTFNANHATDFLLQNNSTGTLTLKSTANGITLAANTATISLSTAGAITAANFASFTFGSLQYTESTKLLVITTGSALTIGSTGGLLQMRSVGVTRAILDANGYLVVSSGTSAGGTSTDRPMLQVANAETGTASAARIIASCGNSATSQLNIAQYGSGHSTKANVTELYNAASTGIRFPNGGVRLGAGTVDMDVYDVATFTSTMTIDTSPNITTAATFTFRTCIVGKRVMFKIPAMTFSDAIVGSTGTTLTFSGTITSAHRPSETHYGVVWVVDNSAGATTACLLTVNTNGTFTITRPPVPGTTTWTRGTTSEPIIRSNTVTWQLT